MPLYIEIIGSIVFIVIIFVTITSDQRKRNESKANDAFRSSQNRLNNKLAAKADRLNKDSALAKLTSDENDVYNKIVSDISKADQDGRLQDALDDADAAQAFIKNVRNNRLRAHYTTLKNPAIRVPKNIYLYPNIRLKSRDNVINIDELECSCDYWREHRSTFNKDDPRRLCRCFFSNAISNISDFVTNGYNLDGFLLPVPASEYSYRAFEVEGQPIIIKQKTGSEWLDVIADNRSSNKNYERFSFNLLTKAWSYGASPKNSRIIKMIFQDHYKIPNT